MDAKHVLKVGSPVVYAWGITEKKDVFMRVEAVREGEVCLRGAWYKLDEVRHPTPEELKLHF